MSYNTEMDDSIREDLPKVGEKALQKEKLRDPVRLIS